MQLGIHQKYKENQTLDRVLEGLPISFRQNMKEEHFEKYVATLLLLLLEASVVGFTWQVTNFSQRNSIFKLVKPLLHMFIKTILCMLVHTTAFFNISPSFQHLV